MPLFLSLATSKCYYIAPIVVYFGILGLSSYWVLFYNLCLWLWYSWTHCHILFWLDCILIFIELVSHFIVLLTSPTFSLFPVWYMLLAYAESFILLWHNYVKTVQGLFWVALVNDWKKKKKQKKREKTNKHFLKNK